MLKVNLQSQCICWFVTACLLARIEPQIASAEDAPHPPEGWFNIAFLAEIATQPALAPDRNASLLADGQTDRGVPFVVGSSGGGRFTFRFDEPRRTIGLHFHQTHAIYRAENFRVLADVQGEGRYEVELGRGESPTPPSWSGVSWEPRAVHGLRLDILTGVSEGRRAHPVASEVAIFGEALPGEERFLQALAAGAPTIIEVRKVRRAVDLSGGTRPVVVLVPPAKGTPCRAEAGTAPAWRAVGERLAAKLGERLGVEARVTDQIATSLPNNHNVIAIGNVNTNELVARLTFNHYAYADSLWTASIRQERIQAATSGVTYPGDGEFTLRTVFEPYPWYDQGDVIVIGCDDAAGAERGIAELLRRVDPEAKSLPWTQVVSKPPALEDVGGTEPTLMNWRRALRAYFVTGNPVHARRAIEVLEGIETLYEEQYPNPDDRPSWRATHSWPEEMESNFIFGGWDAFEAYPELSDEQRLRFSLVLLKALRGLLDHVSGWAELGRGDTVTWNHTTYPLCGLYFGARYFDHYYGLAEMAEYLRKAESCFMGQARSWKPQEDADSYLEVTMEACRDYWLAEWRLDWFENGNAARYADYMIAICDSRGVASGFGDTGWRIGPREILISVPQTYWYTRDGRYVWVLNHVTNGAWTNPFHRDVAPVPDTEHVGLRIFPLDEQLYDFTRRHLFYGTEPRSPPNVPRETAFDKIAFRESWNPGAQYMLLDGFGRGKHLHYDTNAIISFVQGGRKWLFDHDYLVRNTTEHAMASVIHDGRADRSVPSCAGLRAALDGSGVAMTATEVRDYMGLDWMRSIFWRKGYYFVVMDRFTAREPGTYEVDLTWKMEDQGTERLLASHVFRADRYEAPPINRDVAIIPDEAASGGRALFFGERSSRWAFVVDLPAGEYDFHAWGYGLGSASDTVFVAAGDSEPLEVQFAVNAYERRAANVAYGGPAAPLRLVGGRQVVSVWPRKRPPVRIDKVAFVRPDGTEALVVEAEGALRATSEDAGALRADRFWITSADASCARLQRYTTLRLPMPLLKLWQRIRGDLETGQEREIANLLYTDTTEAPVGLELRRVGAGVVLVDGHEPALAATGGVEMDGLASDAELLFATADRIAWAGGTFVQIGGRDLVVKAATDGEVELPLDLRTAMRGVLARVAAAPAQASLGPPPAASAPRTEPVWTFDSPCGRIGRLRAADLNGDGRGEILIAAGRKAIALTAAGRPLWDFALGGICNDLNAGEIDPSPGLEVAVASSDNTLLLLDGRGNLLRRQEVRAIHRYAHFGEIATEPTAVAIFDTDGTPRIFVATTNYDIITYDGSLTRRNTAPRFVNHSGLEFQAADVTGDGKREVFCTNRYGHLCGVNHFGDAIVRWYTSIGDMQAALGDLDGDGTMSAVYGSATGDLRACTFPQEAPSSGMWPRRGRWRFNNFGYAVNRIRIGDVDGDGRNEVLIASGTGYLYVLDGAGNEKWRHRVGVDVKDVVLLDHPVWKIACVDQSGTVTLLDGTGRRTTSLSVDGGPMLVLYNEGHLLVALPNRLLSLALP